MAGSAVGFTDGGINIHQVLGVVPTASRGECDAADPGQLDLSPRFVLCQSEHDPGGRARCHSGSVPLDEQLVGAAERDVREEREVLTVDEA